MPWFTGLGIVCQWQDLKLVGVTYQHDYNIVGCPLPAGTQSGDLILFCQAGMTGGYMNDPRLSTAIDGSAVFPRANLYAGKQPPGGSMTCDAGANGNVHGSPGATQICVVYRGYDLGGQGVTAAGTSATPSVPEPSFSAERVAFIGLSYAQFGTSGGPYPDGYNGVGGAVNGAADILGLSAFDWEAPSKGVEASPAGQIGSGGLSDNWRYFMQPLAPAKGT